MIFGTLLFILIILSNEYGWFLENCLFGFWILTFIELIVELGILSRLIK